VSSDPAVIGVVMGSSSDWETLRAATEILAEFGIGHEARVVSAHRMPDAMFAYAESAAARGLKAIIAGAGGAAHLPGMLAAKTTVPILGVPVASRQLQGLDSLYSIVQMPRGSRSPPSPSAKRGRSTRRFSPSPCSPCRMPACATGSRPIGRGRRRQAQAMSDDLR
jgi:5-(carboxyamino)imidazole ribonucleotide mutase